MKERMALGVVTQRTIYNTVVNFRAQNHNLCYSVGYMLLSPKELQSGSLNYQGILISASEIVLELFLDMFFSESYFYKGVV